MCGCPASEGAMTLDNTDLRILDILQQDLSLPVAEIAGRVGLSVTPCWRRIQRLEEQESSAAVRASLNPEKLGVGISVFVAVRTNVSITRNGLTTPVVAKVAMPERGRVLPHER